MEDDGKHQHTLCDHDGAKLLLEMNLCKHGDFGPLGVFNIIDRPSYQKVWDFKIRLLRRTAKLSMSLVTTSYEEFGNGNFSHPDHLRVIQCSLSNDTSRKLLLSQMLNVTAKLTYFSEARHVVEAMIDELHRLNAVLSFVKHVEDYRSNLEYVHDKGDNERWWKNTFKEVRFDRRTNQLLGVKGFKLNESIHCTVLMWGIDSTIISFRNENYAICNDEHFWAFALMIRENIPVFHEVI